MKYEVHYTVTKTYMQGSIEVEAASPAAAVELVEGMEIDSLIDSTSVVDWSVDAWRAEGDE